MIGYPSVKRFGTGARSKDAIPADFWTWILVSDVELLDTTDFGARKPRSRTGVRIINGLLDAFLRIRRSPDLRPRNDRIPIGETVRNRREIERCDSGGLLDVDLVVRCRTFEYDGFWSSKTKIPNWERGYERTFGRRSRKSRLSDFFPPEGP